MQNWFTRAIDRWSDADLTCREAVRLAAMPAYLLRDMGLTLEGRASLARQISRKRQR